MSDKVTVFHVIESLRRGGAEIRLYEDIRNLTEFKHIVCFLFKSNENFQQEFEGIGAQTHWLGIRNMHNPIEMVKGYIKLIGLLKRYKPGIVHSHLFFANIFTRVASVFYPKAVYIQTIHSPDYKKSNIYIYSPLRYWVELFSLLFRKPKFIAVSDYVKRETIKSLKIPQDYIAVIYNYLDDSWFKGNIAHKQNSPKKVVSVGALYRQKGFEHLIKAAKDVIDSGRELELTIAGDGPEKSRYLSLIRELKLEQNVFLAGRLSQVKDFISSADIFVFPSCDEGLGLALIEAMSQGKICIACNVGPIPEIIEDGISGFLVPPKDYKHLSNKIIEIIDNYPGLSAIGQNARLKAVNKFSKEGSVTALRDYYLGSLKENEKALN